jgi:peptide chain release factor 2
LSNRWAPHFSGDPRKPPRRPPGAPCAPQEAPWTQNSSTTSPQPSPTSTLAWASCGGTFDVDAKEKRLVELALALESPEVWSDQKRSQELGKEKKLLDDVVTRMRRISGELADSAELFDLTRAEGDEATLQSLGADVAALGKQIADLEFQRMFNNPLDPNNCFLDVQAGSGGTEAQDWASMLERMYLRYAERKDFKAELLEESAGEVAGIKSATIKITGSYAFGMLRTETGVHRLVRKSPFDSNARRHTSFASVFVYPEVDDTVEVDINPADLRIDVFRASGAGGQHVNKTESAVRITHIPTNTVVQSQNDRSQHRNRAECMAMLKSRLYELEMRKRMVEQNALEASKTDIAWGHQIRSYVLDQSRIKDLRTNVEIGNTQGVLDGDLDDFISASLKQGV